jgi:hypothetical protein
LPQVSHALPILERVLLGNESVHSQPPALAANPKSAAALEWEETLHS